MGLSDKVIDAVLAQVGAAVIVLGGLLSVAQTLFACCIAACLWGFPPAPTLQVWGATVGTLVVFAAVNAAGIALIERVLTPDDRLLTHERKLKEANEALVARFAIIDGEPDAELRWRLLRTHYDDCIAATREEHGRFSAGRAMVKRNAPK